MRLSLTPAIVIYQIILGKSPNFSVTRFSHLQGRGNIYAFFMGLLCALNKVMH